MNPTTPTTPTTTQKISSNDLRTIMISAWRFYRTTRQSFSLCLKRAWANFKLKIAMRNGIVRFYFQKIDGTIREAWGTFRADLIPQQGGESGTTRMANETVQTYFDTERQEYRCFKKLNLVIA